MDSNNFKKLQKIKEDIIPELFDDMMRREGFWGEIKRFYNGLYLENEEQLRHLEEGDQLFVLVVDNPSLLKNDDFLLSVLRTRSPVGLKMLVNFEIIDITYLKRLILQNASEFSSMDYWPQGFIDILFPETLPTNQ